MIKIPITGGKYPSVLGGCASTRVYVREASDGWIELRSYLGSHMYVLIPVNVSMILQSMRWWIFCAGIPHTRWHTCTWILEPSLVWVTLRSSDDLLSLLTPATSFQQVAPFSWDIFHVNTMACDSVRSFILKGFCWFLLPHHKGQIHYWYCGRSLDWTGTQYLYTGNFVLWHP